MLLVLMICLQAFVTTRLLAQVNTAAVSGAVKDTSGDLIPGAKIVAMQKATNMIFNASSNEKGEYTLPFLPPGTYLLTVTFNGFAKYESRDLALSVGDHPTIDVTLVPGATAETVVVTADAPLLATANANLGSLVNSAQVESLPLNGRTPMMLAQYSAGVVSTANPGQVRAFDNSSVSAFSVGGIANKNTEILLDGAPDNASDNAIAYSPIQDTVQEVKMDIFETDAEYGHAGGGVANQSTKSGTNDLHGSAWEFNETTQLAANTWLNGYSGTATQKPGNHFNQYGFAVGGPMVIPHIMHGRNKLFWYFGFEGLKDSQPKSFVGSVPTEDEKNGDFHAWLNLGSQYKIYNPYLTASNGSRTAIPNNCLTSGTDYCAQTGNAGLSVNSVAVALLKYYPSPNRTPDSGTVDQENFFSTSPFSDNYNNEFARADWQVSAAQHLFFTYRYNYLMQKSNRVFGNSSPAIGDQLERINNGATVGETYTFSSTLIGELRLNYTRYQQNQDISGAGFDSTNLGLPDSLHTAAQKPHFPDVRFINYTGLGMNNVTGTLGHAPYNSYGILADVVKLRGNHSIKAGIDLRRSQKGNDYIATDANGYVDGNGYFNFGTGWTQATNTSTTAYYGQDMAEMELGMPTTAEFGSQHGSVGTAQYLALYLQDDWRVHNNVTVNIGLRYDRDFNGKERQGQSLNGFDMTTANPISSAAIASYSANDTALQSVMSASSFVVNGGPTFANMNDRSIYNVQSNMFSPRIGFSYKPERFGEKTVIRGGFGIYVIPVIPWSNSINNLGYSQTTSATITTDNYLTAANATLLSDPFPNGFVKPTGSTLGLETGLGNSVAYYTPSVRNGYSQRWTLGIQHQFSGGILVEGVYEGNSAARIPVNYSPNYIRPEYLTKTSNTAYNTTTSNPFYGLITNGNLSAAKVKQSLLLKTFPQFGTLTEQNAPYGHSNYNIGYIRVEKRAGKGLTLMSSFGFSKTMEGIAWLNYFQSPEHRVSSYDHPERLIIATTYELPFGRGRSYASHVNRLTDYLIGGWKFAGVYEYQVGAPISWGDATLNTAACSRVNFHYNPRIVAQGKSTFNTSCIWNAKDFASGVQSGVTSAQAVLYENPQNHIRTFATNYTTFRVDAANNLDASMSKDIKFTEERYFQLRFEGFNALNRPQFGSPNMTTTSTSFGAFSKSVLNTARVVQVGGRFVF
jgi:hypothetical protein